MKKIIILFLLSISVQASSDEYYDFQLIKCTEESGYFHMRSVGIWNIRNTVWPTVGDDVMAPVRKRLMAGYPESCEADCSAEELKNNKVIETQYKKMRPIWLLKQWKEHEKAIELLEQEYSLYSYGKGFGRLNEEPLVCNIGDVSITINSKTISRRYIVEDDPEVKMQGRPKVTIRSIDNTIKFDGYFRSGDVITIRPNDAGISIIDYCKKRIGCGDKWEYSSSFDDKIPTNLKYHVDALQ